MKKLFLIVGASGSGKSYLEFRLVENYGLSKVVSLTTRQPRKNEVHGKDYFFVSQEEFDSAEKIESVVFSGNSYGVPVSEIENKKTNIVLVVEPEGLKQILKWCSTQKNYKPYVIFFSFPENLRSRLMEQRGDSKEDISKRLWNDRVFNKNFWETGIKPDVIIDSIIEDVDDYVMKKLNYIKININVC